MATKVQLENELSTLRSRLAAALDNTIEHADLQDLSDALLNKIDRMKTVARDQKDEAERELDRLDNAYDSIDAADDAIRDLVE